MENLPLEVLCKILSYLDGPQLLDAGLVCKHWLHASGMLLENITLTVRSGFIPDVTSGRPYVRISFWETNIDDSCVDLLNRFEVLHLKFAYCTMRNSLTSIVKCCDKLLTLETNVVEVLSLFNSLPSLETLNFNFAYAMNANDGTLRRAEFYGPRLKSFCMSPQPDPYYNNKSDPNLTSAAIEEFVRSRAETLKILELPFFISPEVLLNISKLKNLKLESVNLSDSYECSNVIVEFCKNQQFITVLELDEMIEDLSDTTVCDILAHSPALQEFSASSCDEMDQCIVPIFARPNMLRIDLHGCCSITPDSFSEAISILACVNLRVLSLGYTQLQEEQVRALLPLVPYLDELDLRCRPISDDGFREASLRLTRLRKLKLDECDELSGRTLGHLSGLVELSLQYCQGITSEGLLQGVRFQHLRKLDLYQSGVCTDFPFFPKLLEQNPCLIYY